MMTLDRAGYLPFLYLEGSGFVAILVVYTSLLPQWTDNCTIAHLILYAFWSKELKFDLQQNHYPVCNTYGMPDSLVIRPDQFPKFLHAVVSNRGELEWITDNISAILKITTNDSTDMLKSLQTEINLLSQLAIQNL